MANIIENFKNECAVKQQAYRTDLACRPCVRGIANMGCEGVGPTKCRQWWRCRLGCHITRTFATHLRISNSQLTFAVKLLSPDNSKLTSFGLRPST